MKLNLIRYIILRRKLAILIKISIYFLFIIHLSLNIKFKRDKIISLLLIIIRLITSLKF